ncbi:S-adenosyl-L-methionine-dependent methyltransferase [Amniculicola lignicola CBS 123094]|uniref:S-adenosyl-L-methionine-dependent methyltransferase n=1 Tax=Amniculicola lignicola CBS 123094 TaxID=1392246 RepID=A0A6A5WG84_9PLEO|nr:S-adenosyl-L-methionine-dependent methyltransferase [Amniculicola lignicola CBS 123094]
MAVGIVTASLPPTSTAVAKPDPSAHAISQYTTTSSRLAARLAIHTWNTHPESWFAWAGSRIPNSGSILEVGAGTGQLWRETPTTSATKLALTDFSPAMCEELRGLKDQVGAEVEVRQCGAEELPFEDQTFDVVVANHMLYHVNSPSAALAEFSRVLKPGGAAIIALNGMDHLDELLSLGEKIGRPSTIRNQARITAENARGYLDNVFGDIREERFPGAFEVGTVQPVVDYLGSLDDEGLDEIQVGIVKDVVGKKIEENGVFRVNKNMVLFSGRKL